ncbi:class I SAM-dependent methyltransferase [Thalassospira sp. MA62]|nr:class I SAM-dependent methyltransferase [Thalassospira sp. MA62]
MTDLTVLVFVLAIGLLISLYAVRLRAVPMPSSKSACAEIIKYLPNDIKTVTDFGSGWGDLALAMARARPDISVTGVELSPVPYVVACLRRALAQTPNLAFVRADFRRFDRDPGDVVVCFLDPRIMGDVGDVVTARMAPGSVVISRAFSIPGLTPFGEIPMTSSNDRLYLYRIA